MRVIGDGLSKKARSGSVDDIRQRNDEKREVVGNSGLDSAFKRIDPTWALDVKPTLNFDFARNDYSVYDGQDFVKGQLVDHANFQRNSEATYFDATGVLRTAAVDEPRFTYENGEAKGLLIEEQRTNLLLWSEDFSNAVWNKRNVTIEPNDAGAPDGTQTADKVVEFDEEGFFSVRQDSDIVSGESYTLSAFVKPDGRNFAMLALTGGFDLTVISVDLTDSSVSVEEGQPSGYGAKSLANGWVFVWVSQVATSTTSGEAGLFYVSDSGVWTQRVYQGDGTSGVYLWGAQLEAGSFPASYIATEGSQVTRAADNASVDNASVDDLSGWFGTNEGAWLIDYESFGERIGENVIMLSQRGGSPRIDFRTNRIILVGTDEGTIFSPSINGNGKAGFSTKHGSLIYAKNGEVVTTLGEFTVPVMSSLNLGSTQAGGARFTGIIKNICYIPRALSAAELEALTAPD